MSSLTRATRAAQPAVVPPWRDVRVLRIVGQVVVLGVVLFVGYLLWNNLTANMARARLGISLDFLRATAGFDISQTVVPYSARDSYGHAFLVGLANTLMVSAVGIVLATILGVITGVARLSTNWLVSKLAAGYVELMRNTPLLVQLVLLYAVLLQLPVVANSIALPGPVFLNQRGLFLPRPVTEPTFGLWLGVVLAGIAVAVLAHFISARRVDAGLPTRGIGRLGLLAMVVIAVVGWFALNPVAFDVPAQQRFNFTGGVVLTPPFAALLFGLVIYTAAFIGEVVRGGIQAVRRGQIEAAYSIGLTPMQSLRLIVFPQALRVIVPPLTSQYLNLTKNSSLAIAVGFADVFAVSRTMANQTGQPVPVILLVMATYLTMSLVTSLLMNLYNRRVQVLER
ncbi:MAG TPA: ABC transporter permease subunit [Candidatus Caenarcaniphilales bacterium]|nr:ABC transporter permease subunit [Candidatus Caenarcaniphilales bacterium]